MGARCVLRVMVVVRGRRHSVSGCATPSTGSAVRRASPGVIVVAPQTNKLLTLWYTSAAMGPREAYVVVQAALTVQAVMDILGVGMRGGGGVWPVTCTVVGTLLVCVGVWACRRWRRWECR